MKILNNKVAVVTGAGRGIGRAIAIELASQGAMVVVNDLGAAVDGSGNDNTPAQEVVSEIIRMGGRAVANYDSVADEKGCETMVTTALEEFGNLDIMVCCAGILRDKPVDKMTTEIWDSVIKVHLYGVFYCTRSACRQFKKQRGGRLIAISSPTVLGFAGRSNYSAAKSGILGFIRSVALEMNEYNTTANIVWPNAATRMTEAESQDKGEQLPPELPGPECTATLVAYLASNEAGYINGQTFDVFGGKIALIAPERETKVLYKENMWRVNELKKAFPITLGKDLIQPHFVPPV